MRLVFTHFKQPLLLRFGDSTQRGFKRRLTAERQAAHEIHHITQTLREKLTAALTQVDKIESATLEAMEKADDLADLDTLVQQMQS